MSPIKLTCVQSQCNLLTRHGARKEGGPVNIRARTVTGPTTVSIDGQGPCAPSKVPERRLAEFNKVFANPHQDMSQYDLSDFMATYASGEMGVLMKTRSNSTRVT